MTTGATEAIAAAILALVDPGDEVVALEPYYDSYVAVHRVRRRRPQCPSRSVRRTSGSTSTRCGRRHAARPGCC